MSDRYTRVHALLALLLTSQVFLVWYAWDVLRSAITSTTRIGAAVMLTASCAAAAFSLHQLALPAWRMLLKRRDES